MSYIQLPAEKVKPVCEKYLELIENNRDRMKDSIINSHIGKIRWFRRIKICEEAKAYCTNLSSFSDYYMLNVKTRYEIAAEQLLLLSTHGDPVTITHEHSFILEYL
jgi:hypothetical protein